MTDGEPTSNTPRPTTLTGAFRFHPAFASRYVSAPHDVIGERRDHAAVFPFVEAPHGRGEHEDAGSGVSELQQLHGAAERWAEPLVVFAVHAVSPRRYVTRP